MTIRRTTLIAFMAIGLGACGADTPLSPRMEVATDPSLQRPAPGTGLVLENLTGVTAPVISLPLGEVVIDQAIITDLQIVEDIAGTIIGLQAEGVLRASGGVLGTDVVTEDFTTTLGITSSGPGQCDVVTLDLGPIDFEALDPLVTVDVPQTTVAARGSGAVGSLLCNLGALLGTPGRAVAGIVNALNGLI